MKKLLLLIIPVLITVSGCKKDPCKDVTCENGGICNDGTCDCPDGFTGMNCETVAMPVADFTFTGDGCTAACSILFSNSSNYADSYQWEFGDGSSSTDESPTHEYAQGGTYTVTLTATNASGSATHSEQVLIQSNQQQQLPSASFSISNNGCTAACVIGFNNNSTNATSYSWSFGDGGSSSSSSPSHTYSSGGTYTVTLTATNQYGNDSYQQTVTIASAPTSVRITGISILSAPLSDGGSQWDFDGAADVYYDVETSGGSTATSSQGSEYTNVTSYPISWTYNTTPWQVNNLNQQYRVVIWDNDVTSADDYMGQTNLFSFGSYSSYPSTITVTGSGVSVKFTVTWL